MTLSDYLVRRDRQFLIPGGIVVLVTAAFAVHAPQASLWGTLESVVLALFMAGYALFSHSARCPRCQVRLGYIDLGGGKRPRVPLPGLDGCSNCGLHRNETLPSV